jgi:hypothetical protein
MLRASSETSNLPLDPRAITDPSIDPLVEGGQQLIRFVDAVIGSDDPTIVRSLLAESLGPAAVADAAGVIANFEMMNRIAEGTGMPVGKGSLARTEEWRSLLGLDRYRHD